MPIHKYRFHFEHVARGTPTRDTIQRSYRTIKALNHTEAWHLLKTGLRKQGRELRVVISSTRDGVDTVGIVDQ